MIEKKCPVCSCMLEGHEAQPNGRDAEFFDCPNCGTYEISRTALKVLKTRVPESRKFAAALSHSIRKMSRRDGAPRLSSYDIEAVAEAPRLPGPAEQAENFVLWLGREQYSPGKKAHVSFDTSRAVIGATEPADVSYILKSLEDRGIVEANLHSLGARPRLTFEGWELYEQLQHQTSESSRAVMAMAYGNAVLARVVEAHFKPAVQETGFELIRIDDNLKAGSIDDQMRVEIRRSRFLIADLTDDNPGAYWEAGFAEALGKPVIYTCEKSVFETRGTHFDTNHHHTVKWNPADPQAAADDLKTTIRATLPEEARMFD